MLEHAEAAFGLVLLFPDKLIAARDPWGIRPLVMGRMGNGYVVASETCAFDQIGAVYEREILPGEMLVCKEGGYRSFRFGDEETPEARCLLEHIYFSRPDSILCGETPHTSRVKSGMALALEHPAEADIVVAIPDSGLSAAQGYARQMGLPLERGLIRNHYIGRSFIAPSPEARAAAVRMKHNAVKELVRGKRVVLVDDSLTSGCSFSVGVCTARAGCGYRRSGKKAYSRSSGSRRRKHDQSRCETPDNRAHSGVENERIRAKLQNVPY